MKCSFCETLETWIKVNREFQRSGVLYKANLTQCRGMNRMVSELFDLNYCPTCGKKIDYKQSEKG